MSVFSGLCGLTTALLMSIALAGALRADDGPLLLYTFESGAGVIVRDLSGVEPALDLHMHDSGAVGLSPGRLQIKSGTHIQSLGPASKLIDAVRKSHELSVEAWVVPSSTKQDGPARILTLSKDTSHRNFTLGQDRDRFDFRLRTTRTSHNGLPSLATGGGTLKAGTLHHFTFTRSREGLARTYLNGQRVAERKVDGDLSNWDRSYRLALGNEFSGERPFLGTYHRIAIYARALSRTEVRLHHELGADALLAQHRARKAERLFEERVAPILAKHCLECHDSGTRKGKLDLSRKAAALAGGSEGPSITPGNPAQSLLLETLRDNDMPKKRPPLSDAEKQVLHDWVAAGAPWTLDFIDSAVYVHGAQSAQTFVRRLTRSEYVATVKAATGVDIAQEAHTVLPADLRADGFSNTAYNLGVDLKHVDAYAQLARAIVRRMDVGAFANRFSANRSLNKQNRALIEQMGQWLLRGPLSEQEVAIYRGVVTKATASGADFDEAIGYAIEAMLQSPRFLYRIEKTRPGAQVQPFELAARISYILWGAPPDRLLYEAARKNELDDPQQLAAQIRRMLADPRAISQSQRFVSEWLDLDRLANLRPSRKHYPNWKPLLAADMRTETLAYFRELVWERNRPLAELFNAQFTYLTPRLARHYGIPVAEGSAVGVHKRYDLADVPGRGGLLTQGSLLTVGGDEASMVSRGLFILHELLRGVVRDPPPCVDTTPVPTRQGLTQRGISMERLANDACKSCHTKFEPLAFGLEPFDGMGSYRLKDRYGNALRQDGTLRVPGQSASFAYGTADELMLHLAASERVKETLTWKFAQFALGRPLGASDVRTLAKAHLQAQKNAGTYQALATAIILSDLVRKY